MKIFLRSGWFGKHESLQQNRSSAKARLKRPFTARPCIEMLEDRLVPATFTVNTLADTVDAYPGPVTSLRDAITAANSQAGDDIINFSVTGTINLNGSELPQITSNISINGPGASLLAVSGNQASRVFEIGAGAVFSISGLTISNGFAYSSSGGGILNEVGTGTVSNCDFSGNSAGDGGGIATLGGTLAVSNCTFSGNSANDSNGGGGGILNSGTLNVSDCTLSDNNAFNSNGGGILNGVETSLTVNNSTLSGNYAGHGGGGIFNGGLAAVNDSTLSNNSADNGGGIDNETTLVVNNSNLSGNSAGYGGGIWNTDFATVNDSTLSNNSADNGGGINNQNGTLVVNNSTLSGNSANISGGGIASFHSVTVNNSIVANSPAGGDVTGSFTGSNNLFGIVPLGPLRNNGGPTETIALPAGSPAIDAGNNSLVPTGITNDQRGPGFPRFFYGTVDIGAFEMQSLNQVATTVSLTSTANPSIIGQPVTLTTTVSSASGTPYGKVEYLDGGILLDKVQLVGGVAQYGASGLAFGNHQLTALYDGNGNFASSSATLTQSVNKIEQTISFPFTPPAEGTYQAESFTLGAATASSGLPVSLAVLSGPAFISGTVLTITGTGTVVIEAAQPGDGIYNAAPVIDRSFTVNNIDQTISFPFTPPAEGTNQADSFTLAAATASSGLPVSLAVLSGPAFISGTVLTITGTGTVVIEAAQPGDGIYNAAPVIDRSFTVNNFNPIGSLDPTFGNSGKETIDFTSVYNQFQGELSNLGQISSYSEIPYTNDRATGVEVGPDGTIFLAGPLDASIRPDLADWLAFYSAGDVETSLTSDGGVGLEDFGGEENISTPTAVQPDGKTIVVGTYQDDFLVQRHNPDGSLDTTFGNAGSVTVDFGSSDDVATGVAVQPDGKIVVVGYSYQGASGYDFAVARLEGQGTSTTVSSSLESSFFGQSVTLTATVGALAPGAGTPTGTVQFQVDGQNLGNAVVLDANANASITTSTLPAGRHAITAVYSGETAFFASSGAIAPLGIITTVAGNGTEGYSGDGGPATAAQLNEPAGVAVDAAGDLFIADYFNNVIREVSATGIITTVAGNGTIGYSGDGGPATAAQLGWDPAGVAVDAAGDLFIADTGNNVIRKVSAAGIITTVAGNGSNGYSGDGGSATAAQLNYPNGVAVDATGDLFIADWGNNVIREVSAAGIITTVAGNGSNGYSGDGGQAATAQLNQPYWVAVDAVGDLFIADTGNNVIREVNTAGIITTVAGMYQVDQYGNLVGGYSGDGGPATAAQLQAPTAVAVDGAGDLFIADTNNNVIREVTAAGVITTVAGIGGGQGSYSGDGGPSRAAGLNNPTGVVIDAAGDLFIVDTGNNVIREVIPPLFLVSSANTSSTVTSSSGTSVSGQVVIFTAIVGAVAPGSGTPTGTVTFMDGSTTLGTATLNSSGQATLTTGGLSVGTHTITVSYAGDGDFTGTSAHVTQQVNAVTAASLQQALSPGNPVTVEATAISDANALISAVNGLPSYASSPVTVTLNLAAGTSYTDVTASPPAGVTLVINGNGDSTIVVGHSPALTVASGNVIITGVIFTTATNAPTILVTGGHLTLRNDVVEESTGYSQAAISITGGTLDLGTATDLGGNTINVNGAGELINNPTFTPITAIGDTFTLNAIPLAPSSLSGTVFMDLNDDGQVDFGEKGIASVKITLSGTDFLGNSLNLSTTTDADGAYVFLNLRPGSYRITETQPAGYPQGVDTVGTAGGSLAATDQFFVQLGEGVDGMNYNYGEQPPATGSIKKGQAAGIGFWNNKNGQALILALNGGTGHQLGDWLAATMPNTFGAKAGGNNLTGKSNAFVAALFQQDFLMKGVKLDAQVLATALSVYVTDSTLDSTAVAAQYGFTVSSTGLGTDTVNVGSNGDAFSVTNNTSMTVLDLLVAADAQAVNGVLYNGNATKRNEANSLFSALNEAGGI